MAPRILLLGIPVDPVTPEEAIAVLKGFLSDGEQHHVMTPNNEMLVEASGNRAFADVLRSSSFNLPDSTGLLWAARRTGQQLPARVTGVDTVIRLCSELGQDQKVFLLGAAPGVAEKAAEALRRKHPALVIAGTHSGSPSDTDAPAIIQTINTSGASILFVAFGAPAQDMWIHRYLTDLPSVKVAMGVGGTFDFLAGMQKRAPLWMQNLGLEWLWRFIRQPSRAPRMWKALITFPWLVSRYGKEAPLTP